MVRLTYKKYLDRAKAAGNTDIFTEAEFTEILNGLVKDEIFFKYQRKIDHLRQDNLLRAIGAIGPNERLSD